LATGVYEVMVEDGSGCKDTQQVTLNEPQQISVDIVVRNGITCQGSADGELQASYNFGVAPYTFLWGTGETTEVVTGQDAGQQTLTVTDANGCSKTDTITMNDGLPATIQRFPVSDPSCVGKPDGAFALVQSNFGNAQPTVTNSAGQNIPANYGIIPNLTADTYYVVIDNGAGCGDSDTVVLTAPQAINLSINIDQLISSQGATDGQLTANASGGTGALNYQWTNGPATATYGNLGAGTYEVTVTDQNGCSNTASETLIDGLPQGAAQSDVELFPKYICSGQPVRAGLNIDEPGNVIGILWFADGSPWVNLSAYNGKDTAMLDTAGTYYVVTQSAQASDTDTVVVSNRNPQATFPLGQSGQDKWYAYHYVGDFFNPSDYFELDSISTLSFEQTFPDNGGGRYVAELGCGIDLSTAHQTRYRRTENLGAGIYRAWWTADRYARFSHDGGTTWTGWSNDEGYTFQHGGGSVDLIVEYRNNDGGDRGIDFNLEYLAPSETYKTADSLHVYYYEGNLTNFSNLVGVDMIDAPQLTGDLNWTSEADGDNVYTPDFGQPIDLDEAFVANIRHDANLPVDVYDIRANPHGESVRISWNGGAIWSRAINFNYAQLNAPFGSATPFNMALQYRNRNLVPTKRLELSFLPSAPKAAGFEAEMADISLYPNPATNSFTVSLPAASEEAVNLQLVDLQGRTLLNKVFTQGQQQLNVDLPANLAHGLYLVQLSGGYSETLRVVIGQ